jgi:hypothetical protein
VTLATGPIHDLAARKIGGARRHVPRRRSRGPASLLAPLYLRGNLRKINCKHGATSSIGICFILLNQAAKGSANSSLCM